ncbi:hypothetical protein Rt10032_c21g6436 [Rhodotorula toruloides]|uniref:EamA domain-containing protein n=1 Tax=Rhodotorula toruloides TaxID=5286 RepID=A0A511KPX0_RHOTO|nr:hypothetical protein Rt10032_c21g6436 [Rhodotorula toruloides]
MWALRRTRQALYALLPASAQPTHPHTSTRPGSDATGEVNMRKTGAAVLLGVVLVAYTLQTELASYAQHELGFKKPYFLFYLTHSSYIFLFPLHLIVLALLRAPVRSNLATLVDVIAFKYSEPGTYTSLRASVPSSPILRNGRTAAGRKPSTPGLLEEGLLAVTRSVAQKEWVKHLAKKALILTFFISAPALSWYAAVPLTSMTDITAIYNWAYLLSLYYLPTPATSRASRFIRMINLVSVLLAVCGVFVIAYGNAAAAGGTSGEAKNRLVGNGLALFGSLAYAGYEVWYKLKISLSETSHDTPLTPMTGTHARANSSLSDDDGEPSNRPAANGKDDLDAPSETSSLLPSPPGTPDRTASPLPHPANDASSLPKYALSSSTSRSRPSPLALMPSYRSSVGLPPRVTPTLLLLYSNTITSLIGLCTFGLLWVPILALDWCGWEKFEWPPEGTGLVLIGIAAGGIVFNGGFMILLSLWGPVTASVANLLTLLLVSLADALFVPSAPPMTTSTLIGGGMIVGAFAGLIVGEVRGEEGHAEGRGVDVIDDDEV